MNLTILIVASLAAWRIARMIAIEEGPFSIFARLRGAIDPNQKSWIGRGLGCMACLSFWIAGLLAWAAGMTWLEWLGIAGLALIIQRWTT
jgi:hypothetical protein